MEKYKETDWVAQSVETVAQMMAVAAITAPKTKGENFVEVKVLRGTLLQDLGEAMVAYGARHGRINFDRDGANIARSDGVVLIGLRNPGTAGLNCGACGYETCAELLQAESVDVQFRGPVCAYRLVDLGIAVGSAVKIASLFNVDNRIMYRIGAVARDAGLVDWEFVLGVPLSVTGKNIYFDRELR